MPADTPVTTPATLTFALALLLLHVPPPVVSTNVIVPPATTEDGPVIGAGVEFTITAVVAVDVHPVAAVAVMVYTPLFPATAPATFATNAPGEVIAVPPGPVHKVELAPVAVPVRVNEPPAHKEAGDAEAPIPVGTALTVTIVVVGEPQPFANCMVAVPAARPVTIPVAAPTEALPAPVVTLHVLVPPASVNVTVDPGQIGPALPLTGPGTGSMETVILPDIAIV